MGLWQQRREQEERREELRPVCELAAQGSQRSVARLVRLYDESPDPELLKALSMLADPRARLEVARLWATGRHPTLTELIQRWHYLAPSPPELRLRTALLLGEQSVLRESPDPYLPSLPALADKLSGWVSEQLPAPWRDALFHQMLVQKLPAPLEQALLAAGLLPEEPTLRSTFLLLTEQAEELEALDFDGSFLKQAYESAGAGLRARMLASLRRLGKAELAVRLTSGSRLEGQDLSLSEWETHFELLRSSGKLAELWGLVGRLPPLWAAQVLDLLRQQNFLPAQEEDRSSFQLLLERLPPNLVLTPEELVRSEGAPLTWLTPRELLLGGPKLCRVDLKEVHLLEMPVGFQGRNWRLSPAGDRLAVVEGLELPYGFGRTQYATRLLARRPGNPVLLSRPVLDQPATLAFSPDGRCLAVLEGDCHLRLLNTMRGPAVRDNELTLRPSRKWRLFWLGSDQLLCAGLEHQQLVRVDPPEVLWTIQATCSGRLRVRPGRGEALLLFDDSRLLRVVDRETGALQGQVQSGEPVHDAVLGPGGTVLSAGLTHLEVREIASGQVVSRFDAAHSRPVRFAPDGFRLARARSRVLELIDTHRGVRAGVLGLPGPITELDFSPDGMLLAVGVAGRQTHVFAVPPCTSVQGLSSEALDELEQLAEQTDSPAWAFLAALARFRLRHALSLMDQADLSAQDYFLIEVEG
ncbi:hypothetical protein DYH09_07860 [bacterium CPR1]|nr:hypothetical protein [bacterium CPR1]